jgi:hypothetical protein
MDGSKVEVRDGDLLDQAEPRDVLHEAFVRVEATESPLVRFGLRSSRGPPGVLLDDVDTCRGFLDRCAFKINMVFQSGYEVGTMAMCRNVVRRPIKANTIG